MTEPLTDMPRTPTNGTSPRTRDPMEPVEPTQSTGHAHALAPDAPPVTPGWVKAFGIVLVVLLLAFAGMHLTGNGPMHMGSGGAPHSVQLP